MIYIEKTIFSWVSFYFAIFYFLFISLSPVKSNDVYIDDQKGEYPLGKSLSYYVDKTSKLTIEDILNTKFDSEFVNSNVNNPSFGFQDSTFWVKLSFVNTRAKKNSFYIEEAFPAMDLIEAYTFEDNLLNKIQVGDSFPFFFRQVRHRNHLIPVSIPPGSSKKVYLKFHTKSVMAFRLTLHDESSISMKTSTEQFYFGMFYGVILVLLVTNFFLYFSLKEKLYIYYVSFAFCLGMYFFVFNGFAFAFFWQNSVLWNDLASPFFMTLTALTGSRTAIHFLKLAEYFSIIKKILDGFSLLVIFNILFLFILPYKYSFYYLYILILPLSLVIFLGSLLSVFKKNPLAKFFLFGFFGFIVCGIFTSMNNLGILEGYISPDLMQVASGFAIVILSIGLGHRYYLLKQQNLEIETNSVLINSRLNRIQNELEIAKKIHESLLPAKLPSFLNAKMYAKYVPSGEIGGDFYDFHYSDDRHLGIFIADVTGHGVPAALFASTVKFSFSREAQFLKEPSKLMANINLSLFERIGNNFLSAGYLYLDLHTKKLIYASCGHPPLLIWKREEKEFVELKPKGRLIGIAPDITLHDTVYKLESGDRILFYTDGLIECENGEGIPFGESALHKFALAHENLNAQDFSNSLVKSLNSYSATKGTFSDDVTFIVIDVI